MQGFLIMDYATQFPEAIAQLAQWVKAGNIHYEVDVQETLEKAPEAFKRLLNGKNFGKQLLAI